MAARLGAGPAAADASQLDMRLLGCSCMVSVTVELLPTNKVLLV